MQAPAAEFIEMAADSLTHGDVPQFIAAAQLKELHSFGDERAKSIGATGVSDDFQAGYRLGLETARVLAKMGGQL